MYTRTSENGIALFRGEQRSRRNFTMIFCFPSCFVFLPFPPPCFFCFPASLPLSPALFAKTLNASWTDKYSRETFSRESRENVNAFETRTNCEIFFFPTCYVNVRLTNSTKPQYCLRLCFIFIACHDFWIYCLMYLDGGAWEWTRMTCNRTRNMFNWNRWNFTAELRNLLQ